MKLHVAKPGSTLEERWRGFAWALCGYDDATIKFGDSKVTDDSWSHVICKKCARIMVAMEQEKSDG